MTRSLSTALDSLEDWWQSSQAITQEPLIHGATLCHKVLR